MVYTNWFMASNSFSLKWINALTLKSRVEVAHNLMVKAL